MARRPISVAFETDERRLEQRAPVTIDVDLRKPGRTPFRVTLRDLSRTGCRADTVTRTRAGDRVWITLPGFAAIEGTIRWRTPRGFGCEWATPIHAAVFDHIRKAHPELVD